MCWEKYTVLFFAFNNEGGLKPILLLEASSMIVHLLHYVQGIRETLN